MLKKEFFLAPKKQLTCVLLFFGAKSWQLRSCLVNSVDNTIRFYNLKVVFRSQVILKSLFRLKDGLNKDISSFLAYMYTYSNCNFIITVKPISFFSLELRNIWVDHLLQCNFSAIYWFWLFWYSGCWELNH